MVFSGRARREGGGGGGHFQAVPDARGKKTRKKGGKGIQIRGGRGTRGTRKECQKREKWRKWYLIQIAMIRL